MRQRREGPIRRPSNQNPGRALRVPASSPFSNWVRAEERPSGKRAEGTQHGLSRQRPAAQARRPGRGSREPGAPRAERASPVSVPPSHACSHRNARGHGHRASLGRDSPGTAVHPPRGDCPAPRRRWPRGRARHPRVTRRVWDGRRVRDWRRRGGAAGAGGPGPVAPAAERSPPAWRGESDLAPAAPKAPSEPARPLAASGPGSPNNAQPAAGRGAQGGLARSGHKSQWLRLGPTLGLLGSHPRGLPARGDPMGRRWGHK